MSPTVLREDGFRLYFFSREEARMHIHVYCARGEAKFWIEPRIELAVNHGLTQKDLADARQIIRNHEPEIRRAWHAHFGR